MHEPPEYPELGKIIAIRPPSPERMRADLVAVQAELAQLLALERAPTPAEVAAIRRKLVQPVDHAAELPNFKQRVEKLARYGKRLPTGYPTLDLATRGGLPAGKRMILIGAPGVSKTGLGLNIVRAMIYAGCHVGVHAADEDLDSLLVRIGQTEGLCREDLEEGNVWSLEKLSEYLDERYYRMLAIDQEEDGWTLDDTVDELVRRRDQEGSGAMVLFLDSIQTVRIRGHHTYRSKREEIDAIVARLKSFSARGILIIATSEMNRRGYASKIATENVEDIASAAESRSIEFAAHIMLTLKSVKDHEDLVAAQVPKNRLGRGKPKFRLKINFDRATLSEAEKEHEPTPENEKAKTLSRRDHTIDLLADKLYEALLKARVPIKTNPQLFNLVKGNSDDKRDAKARLENDGRIFKDSSKGYRAVSSTTPHPTAPKSHPTSPNDALLETAPTAPMPFYEVKGMVGEVEPPNRHTESGSPDPIAPNSNRPHPTAPKTAPKLGDQGEHEGEDPS